MSVLTQGEMKLKVVLLLIMPSCGVPLCKSYSSKKVKTEDCKGWHFLPTDRDKRQEWLTVIRREKSPDFPDFPPDFRICGLHFSEECFERDLKHELAGAKRTYTLRDDAIPTIFNFKQQAPKRKLSDERAAKRCRKEIVSAIMEVQEKVDAEKTVPRVEDSACCSSESVEMIPDDLDVSILDDAQLDESFTVEGDEEDNDEVKFLDSERIIVNWNLLKPLFSHCSRCGSPSEIQKVSSSGAAVLVTTECQDGHNIVWSSLQEDAGNKAIAASILLSGSSYAPFRESMDIAKIQMFGKSFFYETQNHLLFPAINNVYQKKRREIYERTKKQSKIELVGDEQCDSPGFSATFGTYTLMNEVNDEIVDFFICHVRNAGNSQGMEKYGLKFLLRYLHQHGLNVNTLTTDQHVQVRKFLRTEYPDICHQFDVWHRSKNLKKKLEKLAKKKAFVDIQPWIKSIINHFWWACCNCDGDVTKLEDMWTSVLYHIRNVHRWKGAKSSYKSCSHPKLSVRDRLAKKWLKKNSTAFSALENIIRDEKLLKDLPNLVKFKHSGNIEVFHNLKLKYCPKRLAFSYKGMYARTQLAVLDHNENLGRKQAVTKSNKKREKFQFSKVTKQWVVKEVKEQKTRHYVDEILSEFPAVINGDIEKNDMLETVPETIATTPKPKKEDVSANRLSRFKKDAS